MKADRKPLHHTGAKAPLGVVAILVKGCEPSAEIVILVAAEGLITRVAHLGVALGFQLLLPCLKVNFRCAGSEDGDEGQKKDEVFHEGSLVGEEFNVREERGHETLSNAL